MISPVGLPPIRRSFFLNAFCIRKISLLRYFHLYPVTLRAFRLIERRPRMTQQTTQATAAQPAGQTEIRAFQINIPEDAIADLRLVEVRIDSSDPTLSTILRREFSSRRFRLSRSIGRLTTTGANARRSLRPSRISSQRSTDWTFISFTCARNMKMLYP